jgi:hypothetical protein
MKKTKLAKSSKLQLRQEALRLLTATNLGEVAGAGSQTVSCCDMGTCESRKRIQMG